MVVPAALCATVAVAGWVAGGPTGLNSRTIANAETPIEVIQIATAAVSAAPIVTPQATTGQYGKWQRRFVRAAARQSRRYDRLDRKARQGKRRHPFVRLSLDAGAGAKPVLLAATSSTDPLHKADSPAANSKALDACVEPDVCIDQYLWSLYQRTPKRDTIKVEEQRKVTVKKKGKTRTVIEKFTKLVDEDFTWKDPKAAEKASMSLKDYVIGGMDWSFKLKLYHALRALDEAGLSPGITSAFRDDYRQSLVSGLKKAASDRSYHGGSWRGGYGHGLAADLVSVKGETRAERSVSSASLWRWIDEHGKEFGIGRPYLDKDPPHVAPIDGIEYVDKRGLTKARLAGVKRPSLSSNIK